MGGGGWLLGCACALALAAASAGGGRAAHATVCAPALARQVRRSYQEHFVRPLEAAGVPLGRVSRECPLHPARDALLVFERHLIFDGSKIYCAVCGKAFKGQLYADLHMANRHADRLPANGTCLADLCSATSCKLYGRDAETYRRMPCFPHHMRTLRGKCQRLLAACIPDPNATEAEVVRRIEAEWCGLLDCDARQRLGAAMDTPWQYYLWAIGTVMVAVATLAFYAWTLPSALASALAGSRTPSLAPRQRASAVGQLMKTVTSPKKIKGY